MVIFMINGFRSTLGLILLAQLLAACSYLEQVKEAVDSAQAPAAPTITGGGVLIVPEGLVLKQWNGELQQVLEDRGYEVYVQAQKNSFIFEFVSHWIDGEQQLRVVWPPMLFEQTFSSGERYTMELNYPRSYREALELREQRPLPIWMSGPNGDRIDGFMLYQGEQ